MLIECTLGALTEVVLALALGQVRVPIMPTGVERGGGLRGGGGGVERGWRGGGEGGLVVYVDRILRMGIE